MTNIHKYMTVIILLMVMMGCSTSKSVADADPQPTARSGGPNSSDNGIKPFSDVIKSSFEKDEGLFTVYKDGNTYYYEIPDSLTGREMLMVSRIARTADGIAYEIGRASCRERE